MLRLLNPGMSDPGIPELFHRIPSSPLPLFPNPARVGARARGPSWPGLPARGRSRLPASRPSTWGLARQMLQLFRVLSAVSTPDPPNPCLPPLSRWGPAHLPAGRPTVLKTPGGARGRAWGWRVGREEKGKAEAREIRRREKSRARRKKRV